MGSRNPIASLAQNPDEHGPQLMPSRLADSEQKIMWGDEHWARLSGSGGDRRGRRRQHLPRDVGPQLRFGSRGDPRMAPGAAGPARGSRAPEEFRRQLRDLYVAGDDVGLWQAAIRDRDNREYAALLEAVRAPRVFAIELLYSDHEGGQRAIGRFPVAPLKESWLCSVVRHWNLDRPDPR